MHAPFSTNMTLEEAFEDAMTCVGNRMATGIWRAYAPDTGTKLEALLNPICREEIKRRIVSGNYSSYTVALKDELLKPEKIPRTFLPVGLDVLVASRMVYGNWLLAFQAMGPDGINYALKDAPTEIRDMGELFYTPGSIVFSSDASGADNTIHSCHKQALYEVRDSKITNVSYGSLDDVPGWDPVTFRRKLRDYLVKSKVHFCDGTIFEVEGNMSGALLTINDNSIIFRTVHYYTLLVNPDLAELDASGELDLRVKTTGDDCFVGVREEHFEAYFQAYKKAGAELGFIIGDYQFGEDAEYCGFRFRRLPHGWVRVAAHPQKIWDTLRYNKSKCSYDTCAVVQSLLINYWWDAEIRDTLVQFRAFLSESMALSGQTPFTWMLDGDIEDLNRPARVVFESSMFYEFNRSATVKSTFSVLFHAMAPKKNNKNKSGKKAQAASGLRQPERQAMAMSDPLGHNMGLVQAYSGFISNPRKHGPIPGPSDGGRYAVPRSLDVDITMSGTTAGSTYNHIVVVDLRTGLIHKYTQDVTASGNFVYQGRVDLDEYLSVSEFNDIRVNAAELVVSNETIDAGSNVVSGHTSLCQLTSLDDPAALTEGLLKKRSFGYGYLEGGMEQPLRITALPTAKMMVPRPFKDNGSQVSGDDHVLMFDTAGSGLRGIDTGTSLAQDANLLDVAAANVEGSANGVHHLAPIYSGPVRVSIYCDSAVAGAGSTRIGVRIQRYNDAGVLTTTTELSSATADNYAADYVVRDDGNGVIGNIEVYNDDATATTFAESSVSITFEGGADDCADVLIAGAWGVSGAQSIRFRPFMCLDCEPNESRYLEQQPAPCLLTNAEAALAIRPLLLAGSQTAHAMSMDKFLAGARKFGKGALTAAEQAGRIAKRVGPFLAPLL
jgi:hypothetical protein